MNISEVYDFAFVRIIGMEKANNKLFRTSRRSSIKVAHKIRAFKILLQRRPEMDTNGFYGDTFSSGFGDFYTAKRGLPLPRDRQLV